MQGIYNYKSETNRVSRAYTVAAVFIFCATCNVISSDKFVLYFYVIIIILIIIIIIVVESWCYKVVFTALYYLLVKITRVY